ncbi:MAG: hypothetical protein A3I68_00985 [Candidatus Melainabacteria bacterium RIFCSPLOWO2_02_FULL_35_15]|nr:MAG: hypothetical protein A3F80_09260 [Candidatus Melainabacteria bacterium RIFCSPLOWO2_12_FULL_35_11]OGI13353.1 MAG: hypothetical protein A3I68_00985 [Candidatus Melainabacteria bacterium RIFCSPLOWO2_02_FULL_35_15]
MPEITFISNKTRKEPIKYFFIFVIAVITWVLQISVFSRFLYFDTMPNLMLLGSVFAGISFGPLTGTLFGIIASFLNANILYDHVFYISYPLAGLLAGILIKNLFSDELLFFILLCVLINFPVDFLNGWQYSFNNPINLIDRYLLVSLNGVVLNTLFAPFYYIIMKFITKKLNLR